MDFKWDHDSQRGTLSLKSNSIPLKARQINYEFLNNILKRGQLSFIACSAPNGTDG